MGSLHGSGAEVHAAICDKQLNSWGFGASLDFRSCFDTIDIGLVQRMLLWLPEAYHPWATVPTSHWIKTRRWICFDGCVATDPVQSAVGIPQGDGACPLILGLLLAAGVGWVQKLENDFPGCRLHQTIYMDDRALIADQENFLDAAIHRWSLFADYVHLMESPEKTQKACLGDKNAKRTMEVLGTLIGSPGKKERQLWAKRAKRLEAASLVAKRVGLLPVNQQKRIQSLTMFARPCLTYGWIGGYVPQTMAKAFSSVTWKSAGKLRFECRN